MLRKWLAAVMAAAFLVGGLAGCPQEETGPGPKPDTKKVTTKAPGTKAPATKAPATKAEPE